MSKNSKQVIFEPAGIELADSESDVATKREDTRTFIARIFIWGFFLTVLILIILTSFGKLDQTSAKDYLIAIGTPLGFVVGFYFKSVTQD
jgi:hypothetical protein